MLLGKYNNLSNKLVIFLSIKKMLYICSVIQETNSIYTNQLSMVITTITTL